jgi:thiol-disulfide isomerase/thioredoxin
MLIVAVLVSYGVSALIGRRQKKPNSGNVLSDMLVAALLAARVAFVITWFELYRAAPWSMLDIRDGGFTPWAGIAAALLVALWHGWRNPAGRKPLLIAVAAGALAWSAMFGVRHMIDNEPATLPTTPLMTLAGAPADLATLAAGRPMAVNLWASWCPPCRREMPVLVAAQQQYPGVAMAFVNQGESADTAQHFLSAAQLQLSNVLLDAGTALGKQVGSMALPTTLFYDKHGRLIDTHLGELSAASLANKLQKISPEK